MKARSSRKKNDTHAALRTPAERVGWLLQHRWAGDRSRMAKDNGLTYTAIVKVVTGQQEPGRRLLAKLVEHSDVSAAWLLAGHGSAFGDGAIPATRAVACGMPAREQLATDVQLSSMGSLFTPTRYWLQLQPDHPVVRDGQQKVQAGDLLLMETNGSLFQPSQEGWRDRLCVVRIPGHPGAVELGEVTYYPATPPADPERLEVSFFRLSKETRRLVVDESPTGAFKVKEEWIVQREWQAAQSWMNSQTWQDRLIKNSDVVAVCILLLRR